MIRIEVWSLVVGLSTVACAVEERIDEPEPTPGAAVVRRPAVTPGFGDRPSQYAVEGMPWAWAPLAHLSGNGPIDLMVVAGPRALAVDGEAFSFVPGPEDVGTHRVVLEAARAGDIASIELRLHVAARRLVAERSVDRAAPEGLRVEDTGTALDGLEVEVAAHAGSGSARIVVYALEGSTPPGPREATSAMQPFLVDADLPDGTRVSLRAPAARAPSDGTVAPGGAFFTRYGASLAADGGWFDGSTPLWTTAARDALQAAFHWRRAPTDATIPYRPGVFDFMYAPSVAVSRDQFHVVRLMDPAADVDATRRRTVWVVDTLVRARDAIAGRGCAFRNHQTVYIRDLSSESTDGKVRQGHVSTDDGTLELHAPHVRRDPDARVVDTIAHELAHVFQWIALGRPSAWNLEDLWWVESTAVYFGDTVAGDQDWIRAFSPWTSDVTARGIYDSLSGSQMYQLVTLLESIHATRGVPDYCRFFRERRTHEHSTHAFAAHVGGREELARSFAQWVAAYSYLRTESAMTHATRLFGAADPPFEYAVEHDARGWAEVHWERGSVPGGLAMRYTGAGAGPANVRISAGSTEGGAFAAIVHADDGTELGWLDHTRREMVVRGHSGGLHVAAGFDPTTGPTTGELMLIRFALCPVGECEPARSCASAWSPCSGSGTAFDGECCGDLVCVVGSCVEPRGGRERVACADQASCASGLACRPRSAAGAQATCCARQGDYCTSHVDCCGTTTCMGNRCVGRASGETCTLGDCEGASFCGTDGRCS